MTDKENTKYIFALFNFENVYAKHPFVHKFDTTSKEDWHTILDYLITDGWQEKSIDENQVEKFKKLRQQPPSKNVEDWCNLLIYVVDNQSYTDEKLISNSNKDEHFVLYDSEYNFIEEY